MYTRRGDTDLIVVDGRAVASSSATRSTIAIETHTADAVLFCNRRLRQRLLPVDERQGQQRDRGVAHHMRTGGAFFANPRFPRSTLTCIPVHGDFQSKLTLMSESLAAQRRAHLCRRRRSRATTARPFPERARLLPRAPVSRREPGRATWPHRRQRGLRRWPRRRARRPGRLSGFCRDAIAATARNGDPGGGNLFQMYERSPLRTRMKCRCDSPGDPTTTMGGSRVDYNPQSIPPSS